MTTVKNIYDYINTFAPFNSQEEWDNSGHLVGDFRKEVKTAVLALDCTKEVVEFAYYLGAELIITHHPVIFSALKDIKKGSVAYSLVHNDIAQISVHTPFDKSECGINFNLAELLELANPRMLDNGYVVVGDLEQPMSIDDFVSFVSDTLDTNGIRYTDTDELIKTVAVGGGACSEFMWEALDNADCFLTGDLKYHEMLDAQQEGKCVISAGHYETENAPFLKIKDKLEALFTDIEFVVAPTVNPVKSL